MCKDYAPLGLQRLRPAGATKITPRWGLSIVLLPLATKITHLWCYYWRILSLAHCHLGCESLRSPFYLYFH